MIHIVVIGAGAFGGWTALELARRGARVTLLDAWGPGNARSSSGGETRVLRAAYGSRAVYTKLAARALERWPPAFFKRTGVLWMFGADDGFGRASAEALRSHGLVMEELDAAEAARQYPQIDFTGLATVLFERDAGYLLARRACEHVLASFVEAGGEWRQASVESPQCIDAPLRAVRLIDGSMLTADCFVFACGPWLASLFPDVVGSLVSVTRQEVFYFGTPGGDLRFSEDRLPVWIEIGATQLYGIPGNAHRGFKIADDAEGPRMDPTSGERHLTAAAVAAARDAMARRFPALAGAPLLGGEVCQYESTPDAHYILDRHPAAPNVWIAGGGSGHGFKMGPAIGEILASAVLDGVAPDPVFALSRFAAPPAGGWTAKWS
jgi:glycine/D-amino acid oxidase-like deaminating enzyme